MFDDNPHNYKEYPDYLHDECTHCGTKSWLGPKRAIQCYICNLESSQKHLQRISVFDHGLRKSIQDVLLDYRSGKADAEMLTLTIELAISKYNHVIKSMYSDNTSSDNNDDFEL